MDFHCIEGLLALPEFRVIRQVMNPKQLEFHLELIVLPCQISPKFLKLLKRGHENASPGNRANRALDSSCA